MSEKALNIVTGVAMSAVAVSGYIVGKFIENTVKKIVKKRKAKEELEEEVEKVDDIKDIKEWAEEN